MMNSRKYIINSFKFKQTIGLHKTKFFYDLDVIYKLLKI